MSLYFDGFFACDLRSDTPLPVLDVLRYMTCTQEYSFTPELQHPFFEQDGWRFFLQADNDWTCAPGMVWSDFQQAYLYTRNDADVYQYTISFRRTMHDDVEFYILWFSFLDWIVTYSETAGYVGYYREQYSLHPTLVYFKRGMIYMVEVTQEPASIGGEKWNVNE